MLLPLTLGLSWGYWLGLLAMGLRVGPGSAATHFPGLLGPLVAALIVVTLESGPRGTRGWIVRAFRWPRSPVWWLALSPLLLGALAFGLLHLAGQAWPAASQFTRFPGLPEGWPLGAVVAVILVVNGFGEEGGWRGFALPRLLQKHGRFGATWRVWALWALWHAPLFWLNHSMHAMLGPTQLGWALGLFCGAFVLAQLQLRSEGSVLPVALWHTGYNLMVASGAGVGAAAALCSVPVMVWGMAVAGRWWRAERQGH
ncbi:CPBP family intramembrane glutamic endopeptidase [Roseateles sp.]|uniref:CPBP family intramembrane glutamic endopeptidase n=1 Tax=Roseateles sp. TaxID=1971397 RepID=UPI0039EC7D51